MHANVEDRGNKGDITPLMAAASGGYVDIVKLLLVHCADVNAQSSTGNWGAGAQLVRLAHKAHSSSEHLCFCLTLSFTRKRDRNC